MVLTGESDVFVFLPGSLNECSVMQLELVVNAQVAEEPMQKFAFDWLCSCCSSETLMLLIQDYDADDIADVATTAAETLLAAKVPLTKTPYGMIYLPDGYHLKGPEDELGNICMGQFIDAEEQMFLYLMNKDMGHLAQLVAILFRPTFESKYLPSKNIELAKVLGEVLSDTQILVIFLYYRGVRNMMEANYKFAFPAKKMSESKPILPNDILGMVMGYHRKLVQYAGGVPSKKEREYYTSAWTVLESINMDIEVYQQQMRDLAKHKRNNGKP